MSSGVAPGGASGSITVKSAAATGGAGGANRPASVTGATTGLSAFNGAWMGPWGLLVSSAASYHDSCMLVEDGPVTPTHRMASDGIAQLSLLVLSHSYASTQADPVPRSSKISPT